MFKLNLFSAQVTPHKLTFGGFLADLLVEDISTSSFTAVRNAPGC